MNLKTAQEEKKFKTFLQEHQNESGDADKFEALLTSMAQGKSLKAQKSSSQDKDDN